LIREIERIKRRMPPSPDESPLMRRGRAVDRLLFGDASGNGQGQSELEKIVSWWADRDDDVKREIRQDLMTYLKAFYESDLSLPEEKQRVTAGLQVLYTFEEGDGETVHDVSGVGKALDLKGKEALNWIDGGGLAISAPTLVDSADAATKIIDACKLSNELTIEAWVKQPYKKMQDMARIVTLSGGISDRNFTLDQWKKTYRTRLRTSASDDPDADNRLVAPISGHLDHLVYTRDASGTARFYLNGKKVKTPREIKGDFSNWDDRHRLCLADEVGGGRAWLGELRLVAIYSRALHPDEVSQNYKAGPD
jgi:hypothetical protein